MMPRTFLGPERDSPRMPVLRELARRGAVARVVPVVPSVTYPAHTTLVTGVSPARHGITSNRPPDPLDRNQGGWRWYAEDIAAPTLWQAVHAQGREVALIEWPVTVGAEVSYLVPEYWRAGTAEDQKLLRALSTKGLLEQVAAATPELWRWLTPPNVDDAAQFAIADYLLARRDPDLILLHVWRTDDMEHDHGPGSAQARAAFEAVDAHLGRLVAALERSPRWPNTTLVVVSDHGFRPVERELSLPALFERSGLLTRDSDGAVQAARVTVVAHGGSAFVYASDPQAARQAEQVVRELGEDVARVVPRGEVAAAGGDGAVAFAVAAGPGVQLSDRRGPEPWKAIAGRGAHGYPSDDPAMLASLVAVGPRVPAVDLGVVAMTAIAPTLAAWVGAPLPGAESPPLLGAGGAR